MENQEEPSVLTLLTDFDTENHGLNVMRIALNYRVRTSMKRYMSLFNFTTSLYQSDAICFSFTIHSQRKDLLLEKLKKNWKSRVEHQRGQI